MKEERNMTKDYCKHVVYFLLDILFKLYYMIILFSVDVPGRPSLRETSDRVGLVKRGGEARKLAELERAKAVVWMDCMREE